MSLSWKGVWGLTGGIASGKSLAARFFEEAGIAVIDADQLARELSSEGGAAHGLILKRFGTADRAKLREIVFSDPKARKDLEAILHPLIARTAQEKIRIKGTPALFEAALLVETGRYREMEGLIVIESPLEDRVRRLVARDSCTNEMARQIIASQTDDETRRRAATWVIENSGTPEELRVKVQELGSRLSRTESI